MNMTHKKFEKLKDGCKPSSFYQEFHGNSIQDYDYGLHDVIECPDSFYRKFYCLNGGKCLMDMDSQMFCECAPGYKGDNCKYMGEAEMASVTIVVLLAVLGILWISIALHYYKKFNHNNNVSCLPFCCPKIPPLQDPNLYVISTSPNVMLLSSEEPSRKSQSQDFIFEQISKYEFSSSAVFKIDSTNQPSAIMKNFWTLKKSRSEKLKFFPPKDEWV